MVGFDINSVEPLCSTTQVSLIPVLNTTPQWYGGKAQCLLNHRTTCSCSWLSFVIKLLFPGKEHSAHIRYERFVFERSQV